MSDSVRPHRWQPTRLLRPWDSPGKNTGVGCHFLLQCRKVKSESEVAQSCPTLSDPMDRSLPGFSIHGIFQAIAAKHHHKNLTLFSLCVISLGLLPLGALLNFCRSCLKATQVWKRLVSPVLLDSINLIKQFCLQNESQKPFCQAAKEITFLADS